MDDWSIDDLCAFFVELKMDQYCKFLYQNKYVQFLFNLDYICVVDAIQRTVKMDVCSFELIFKIYIANVNAAGWMGSCGSILTKTHGGTLASTINFTCEKCN